MLGRAAVELAVVAEGDDDGQVMAAARRERAIK